MNRFPRLPSIASKHSAHRRPLHNMVKREKLDSPVRILVVCHYFAFHFSYKCIFRATSVSTDFCRDLEKHLQSEFCSLTSRH